MFKFRHLIFLVVLLLAFTAAGQMPPFVITNVHNWTIPIGGERYGVVEKRFFYLHNPSSVSRSTTVLFHGKGVFGTKMRAEYLVALIVAPLVLAASAFFLRRAGRKPATEP